MAQLIDLRRMAVEGCRPSEVRRALRAVQSDPRVVLLYGIPVFPKICPNCGRMAAITLRMERSFLILSDDDSDTEESRYPVLEHFDVPFCESCLAERQRGQIALSPWVPVRRLFSKPNGFAGLVVIAISGMFFKDALFEFRLFPLLLGMLPLSIGIWLIRPVWKNSYYMTVAKPTKVELALDFTPSLGLAHEPGWRAFVFESASYAEQFRNLNEAQLWNTHSPAAARAAALRRRDSNKTNWIVGVIVAAVLLWTVWSEWIAPLLGLM